MIQVVVATTPGRELWLNDCLKSLGDIPCIVISDYNFELGKIRWMYNNTNLDRWLLLQDSFIIKNTEFWSMLEKYPNSLSINDDPYLYGSYVGIYERKVLDLIEIPQPTTKKEAVNFEIEWNKKYVLAAGNVPVLFTDLKDSMAKGIENKNGRDNLVLENDYLIKYKGTWRLDQL